MSRKVVSREEAEVKEGMEVVNNEVPDNRLQTTQQVATTKDAENVKPSTSSFSPKRTKGKGSALKQQVISDMITGSSNGSGMGIAFNGRSVSGTMGGILGANNSTPDADRSRDKSRVGKKLDRLATKLNYTPCESAFLEFDESKPLADSANEDQGYNGTYRNEYARSQKRSGGVPGDLMYQRSVDLITKDKLYFVEGQQVFQVAADRTALNPSTTIDRYALTENTQKVNVTYHSGNYLHKALHIGLNTDGSADYCYFDVDDISPANVSADDANIASAHRLIKNNVAELDRMTMDAKAGDEKAELWTPLARAIDEPTKASYLMSSIEADTGAYCYLAYSKATTNMAYQLNRGTKDGLEVEVPAMEQFVGWRAAVGDSDDYEDFANLQALFDDDYYKLGDPSLMIAAYDSEKKFNNKADLLLQPRGWRMHLQTADNNMNPLHVPKEFANVYAASEVFSTIDHDYDPLLPICMTDKANLITVHNMNELAGFSKAANSMNYYAEWTKMDPSQSDYKGTDRAVVEAGQAKALLAFNYAQIHPFVKIKTGDGYVSPAFTYAEADGKGTIGFAHDDNNGKRDVEFRFVLAADGVTPTAPTGFTALQVNATNVVIDIADVATAGLWVNTPNVVNATKNVVTIATFNGYYEKIYFNGCRPYAYRYSDLRNKYIVDVKHPLVEGILTYLKESIGGKIRSLINQHDFCIPFVFSTQYMTLAQILICAATPWILRVRENSFKDVLYLEDNVNLYPYSKLESIKNVPFKNYVNFIYKDYDSPLESKIMDPVRAINWIMPEFIWKLDTGKYVLPWYTNELELNDDGSVNNDASCMSFPSIRSGYRLGLLDTLYGMTEKDVRLSLDRITKTFYRNTDIAHLGAYKYGLTTDGQIFAVMGDTKTLSIGDVLRAPRELGLSMDCPLGILTKNPSDIIESHFEVPYASYADEAIATSYRIRIWTNRTTPHHPAILDIDGVNITRSANYSQKWFELTANGATSYTDITGLVFGLGDDGDEEYVPFATLGEDAIQDIAHGVTVISHQRAINTRLQFLPFVISPFDTVSSSTSPIDIWDVGYYFGLAGFRGSDYRESVYNREKEVVNQGLLFVEDPWILASPILKAGVSSTGISLGKGYRI